MNNRVPFVFETHTGSPTGFSEVGALCFRSLLEQGVEVHYCSLADDFPNEQPSYDMIVNAMRKVEPERHLPWVSFAPAPLFWLTGGAYNIGWTMIETDQINERWVRACNSMDEIWVPTPAQVKVFQTSGVVKPIHVIPLGIDTTRFKPDFLPFVYHGDAEFRFMSMSWWQFRKRWDLLTKAFAAEFGGKKEVGILYKTMFNGRDGEAAETVHEWVGHTIDDQLAIIEGGLPWWEVVMTMRACHAFVLPTAGEGWSCPPVQALACGLPVIVTDCQGPGEVLRDDNGKPFPGVYFLPCEKKPTGVVHDYYSGSNWWATSVEEIRKAMREVYQNYDHWKAEALKGAEMVRKLRSGEAMARAVKARLTELYQERGFEPLESLGSEPTETASSERLLPPRDIPFVSEP
jgi:glycosyltransferase involved in cell wall biosynthesis